MASFCPESKNLRCCTSYSTDYYHLTSPCHQVAARSDPQVSSSLVGDLSLTFRGRVSS
uniref:Uncharacterized protein n=1 Tax=Arundo donax TaxID=35708 RepID=A0A0A9BU99_ARUDO